MTQNEFFESFPRWFFLRLRGYQRLIEQREINEWQRVRWQTTALLNISGKSLKKDLNPSELLPLPFDEDNKNTSDIWTDELLAQIAEDQKQDRLRKEANDN